MAATKKIKEEVREFLKENNVAVIATISAGKIPQAATIYYFIDKKLDFYFVTRKHTRKYQNISENKNVAFVVGTKIEPRTAQCNGVAEEVSKRMVLKFIKELVKHDVKQLYFGHVTNPFSKIGGLDLVCFKVKINWLRYMRPEKGGVKYYQVI